MDSSQRKSTDDDARGGSAAEGPAPGVDRDVLIKLTELAALLPRTESARGESEKVVRNAIEQLDPESRETLSFAFGSGLRRELLKTLLDACGDDTDPSAGSAAKTVRVTDEELAALVARLFRQFLVVESVVVDIAVEFTNSAIRQLPRNVGDLKLYTLQLLRSGGDDSVDRIDDYLADINWWTASILTAWAEAPEEWWKDWWGKIKPSTIESRAEVGVFSNKHRQYWNDFCELVRDLNPLAVKSQLKEVAAQMTIRRHEEQKGGV